MRTPIWLCFACALLLAALATGNPFLAACKPPEPGGTPATPPAGESTRAVFATPSATPVLDRGGAKAAVVPAGAEPGPEYRDLVDRVAVGAQGETLWILRDGRILRRNAANDGLEEVLVSPAEAGKLQAAGR